MLNLTDVVQGLKKERDRLQGRIEQLDVALKALTSLDGAGRQASAHASRKRRTMSAAARKRIGVAQRARWAKWKAGQRGK